MCSIWMVEDVKYVWVHNGDTFRGAELAYIRYAQGVPGSAGTHNRQLLRL